jgi:CheY-like chemotaxis protein
MVQVSRRELHRLTGKFIPAQFGTCDRGDRDARRFRPDVVIVDLGLPDEDSINTINRLRLWSDIPVIVLSARTAAAQRLWAFEGGRLCRQAFRHTGARGARVRFCAVMYATLCRIRS